MLDPKGRFEVRNGRIRARYGHTFPVMIDFEEDKEVRRLYHGTAVENLNSILKEGIKPMRRNYVHLSLTVDDALEVGRRHSSNVVVLEVDTECLRARGLKVYKASSRVYVTPYVPPECIVNIYRYKL